MGYEWMPGLTAILRDVTPDEVLQALGNPRRWLRPATGPHGIAYVAVWARTGAGRPIVVVVRLLGGLDAMIVAARGLTEAEIARFEEWGHGHG